MEQKKEYFQIRIIKPVEFRGHDGKLIHRYCVGEVVIARCLSNGILPCFVTDMCIIFPDEAERVKTEPK